MPASSSSRTSHAVLRAAVAATALIGSMALSAVAHADGTGPSTGGSTQSSSAPTPDSRYTGTPVYIGGGNVAVLRNVASDGGPEAWIRHVGEQWKPGDPYILRLLTKLDTGHRDATVDGYTLRLKGTATDHPVLDVTSPDGTTKQYALPALTGATSPSPSPSATTTASPTPTGGSGQGPARCVVTIHQNIGAGTAALMTISPSGPSVLFQGAGEDHVIPGLSLNRRHPKLPAGHFLAEILHPSGSAPQLRTNMEGGGHPASVHAFPKLPQGCSFTYRTDDASTSSGGGTDQTTVVPKGSVAAGYEAPDDSNAPLMAVGGAAAVGAAGIAFVAVRRRTAAATR